LFAIDISNFDSDQTRTIIVSVAVFAKVSLSMNNKRFNDWQRFRLRIRLKQYFYFMKFSLSLALFAAFLVASCSEEPPPPTSRHRVATYAPARPEEYPPPQQPFNPNGPVQPSGAPPAEVAAAPPPPTAAPTKIAKGDYPYGIPVPGKPHLVESPYSPGKYIDVEGFPPGTEVKDPYTDKIFLVP
jgi:hypothetical protein